MTSTITKDTMREHWTALLRSLEQAAEERIFQDPEVNTPWLEAEGMRYLTRMMAAGSIAEMECHDPAYPLLWKCATMWFTYACANPDCFYLTAYVDGEYTYRLFGTRGSASTFDVEIWQGDQSDIKGNRNAGGRTDSQFGPNEIEFGPGGEFEIVLSRDKRDGNWIQIPDGRSYVCIRQLFLDWEGEERGEVYIEREGALYPPPPLTAEDIATRLGHLSDYVLEGTRIYAHGVAAHHELPMNSFRFQPVILGQSDRGEAGTGGAGQVDGTDNYYYRQIRMGQGIYHCNPDEAVILEVPAPQSPHWIFYILSHYWEGLSWNYRPTSLNNSQVQIDSDGMFRAVISHRDPGVPNWIDTSNHTTGLITGRYYRPEPDSVVEPTFRVVPFDQLRDALPADTPTVTPEERADILRRRMHSVRRRGGDF